MLIKFVVLSAVAAVGLSRPGIVETSFGHDFGSQGGDYHQGLSLASLDQSHGLGDSSFGSGGHSLQLEGGDGGWSSEGGGSSGGGDFHHGVSVVGGGGEQKAETIDLTNHGDSHHGPFGGSFVASGKYSAGGHGGGGGGGSEGGEHSFEGGFEGHYSDVLGAGEAGASVHEHLSELSGHHLY